MVKDSIPVLRVRYGLPQEMCWQVSVGNKLQSSWVS